MIPFRRLILFFFIVGSSPVMAQVSLNPAKGFSHVALKEAEERLKSMNMHSRFKVALSISLFRINSPELRVSDQKIQSNASLENTITAGLSENTSQILPIFNDLRKKADGKAQGILNKMPERDNVLLINLSTALWYRGYGKHPKAESVYRFTILHGAKVPENDAKFIQSYVNEIKDLLDFNDVTFKKNNEFLKDLISFISSQIIPAEILYNNPGERSLDANEVAKCKTLPSFQTTPISGIPWKCIPADGTFMPVKVSVTPFYSKAPVHFRLKNAANFKLKSPEPDANSFLWVSGNTGNKETSLIPVIDGVDFEIQKINVVAYKRKILKVAVVLIAEENDDVQNIPIDTEGLAPGTVVVSSGQNHFLDTRVTGKENDDQIIVDPVTKEKSIVAGKNGKCDTYAANMNIEPIDINRDELEKQLNTFYNPVMVQWEVDKTRYTKVINYDLNNDGILDIDSFRKTPAGLVKDSSPEEALINSKGEINAAIPHHLFIVGGLVTDNYPLGRSTGTNNKSAIIFTTVIDNETATYYKKISVEEIMISTCAHELGHSLGLAHVVYDDDQNLMGGGRELDQMYFRKFQWDIIHKHTAP